MAKVQITKEEADRLMKIEGNVKGVTIKTDIDYIIQKKDEEGIERLEKRLEELGYPIKLKEINSFKWYPLALAVLLFLVALETFNWDESVAFNMGYEAPKTSIIIKLFMKYFISLERVLKNASKFWEKSFDFSEVEIINIGKKEKKEIFRLKKFKKFHPLLCTYNQGYLKKLAEMALGEKKIKVEHTKCLFRGDSCEEYTVSW